MIHFNKKSSIERAALALLIRIDAFMEGRIDSIHEIAETLGDFDSATKASTHEEITKLRYILNTEMLDIASSTNKPERIGKLRNELYDAFPELNPYLTFKKILETTRMQAHAINETTLTNGTLKLLDDSKEKLMQLRGQLDDRAEHEPLRHPLNKMIHLFAGLDCEEQDYLSDEEEAFVELINSFDDHEQNRGVEMLDEIIAEMDAALFTYQPRELDRGSGYRAGR